MAKDPAFLFYPGDYLRDTQMLSEKTQVAYDRIICEHMRNICISETQLNFFTKRLSDTEKEELMAVLVKIRGGYEIEWVAESIRKRRSYSDSRAKNRSKKTKKDMNNISKHMNNICKHMEIENENENENEIENNKKVIYGKKFEYNEITVLPENYIQSIEEQLYTLQGKRVDRKKIIDLWESFRLEKITGQTFYNSEKDVFLHFVNWIKLQKFTKTKNNEQGDNWRLEYANRWAEAAKKNP